jgi:hypothetical protein
MQIDSVKLAIPAAVKNGIDHLRRCVYQMPGLIDKVNGFFRNFK